MAEPYNVRYPARDHGRLRVVAEPEPVDASGRERDHVLRRGAELDSDEVGVHVDAEERRVDRVLELLREVDVRARDDGGRGEPAPDLLGEVRPGEHGHGAVADE